MQWFIVFLYNPFYFFISDSSFLGPSFFLISLAKGLLVLLFFSKNQLVVSLIFSLVFFLHLINLHSSLYYFFQLALALVCTSFSCVLRWKGRLSFFLISYKFPLKHCFS